MGMFVATALAVALVGLLAAAWWVVPALWPVVDVPAPDPTISGDVRMRLQELDERVLDPDDDGTPWSARQRLIQERDRLPGSLEIADWLVVQGDGIVVPFGPALLRMDTPHDELLGRRQGRAIHAVRIRDDLFIDLIELSRRGPVLAVELAARMIEPTLTLRRPETLVEADLIAAWLVEGDRPRILPEPDGERAFTLTLEGEPLTIRAWMPMVATGIRNDSLAAAAVVTFKSCSSTGPIGEAASAGLQVEPSSPVGWTRNELLELAATLQQLEGQDVDLSPFVREAFADRCIPLPDPTDEAEYLLTAALLNWVGAAHRRSGRPREALAALDAAWEASVADDSDSRGDIRYNRGLAWVDRRQEDELALEHATTAFMDAGALHPADPDPWIQLAMIDVLRGRNADEHWQQAAGRAQHDLDLYAILMANVGTRVSETPS